MDFLFSGSNFSFALAILSILLCPTLCGVMAYRISSTAASRSL